jgi:hypothetical protein
MYRHYGLKYTGNIAILCHSTNFPVSVHQSKRSIFCCPAASRHPAIYSSILFRPMMMMRLLSALALCHAGTSEAINYPVKSTNLATAPTVSFYKTVSEGSLPNLLPV